MYPDIPGHDSFTGHWIHSHNYRDPEQFRGQRVLCFGAGPSGTDIAIDLSPYAKQVGFLFLT
jgi:cation diffusion facilitator CzcD-associated flavoprotein CzcO